ncbi:MAG TPA: hypothetical protein VNK94_11400 [Gaiellaceae bacterium]|nr:hypothetical protein [Gaiellaceae bacterium]
MAQGIADPGRGWPPGGEATPAGASAGPGRELYVRHARLHGRSLARLRVVDEGVRCVVEAEAWQAGSEVDSPPLRPGPYVFPSAVEATRFVTHAVEALIALGCDVQAS